MSQAEVTIQRTLRTLLYALAVILCCVVLTTAPLGAQQQQKTPEQRSFATPQEAADALIQAATAYDLPTLLEIFGPEGRDFISSSDPVRDKSLALAFVAKAKDKQKLKLQQKDRSIILVGNDDWPFPVPLAMKQGRWYFDSKAGRSEILFRRIGANELDAIQVCRGFVEAQEEYAEQIHDNSGVHQYAQQIISTPGKQNGLFWENPDGTPGGPISRAVARAIEEGYSTTKRSPFHGYYFKVLKGQGPAAPMGKLDYVIQGAMIGGFALLAVPAEYRVTGVKTFQVSNDGIVYEKDLGPESLKIGQAIELYNPDKSWHRTTDQWPPDMFPAVDNRLANGQQRWTE